MSEGFGNRLGTEDKLFNWKTIQFSGSLLFLLLARFRFVLRSLVFGLVFDRSPFV
jgi:hypothetical protein